MDKIFVDQCNLNSDMIHYLTEGTPMFKNIRKSLHVGKGTFRITTVVRSICYCL